MNSLPNVFFSTLFTVFIALICLGCSDGLPETQLIDPDDNKIGSTTIDPHKDDISNDIFRPTDDVESLLLDIQIRIAPCDIHTSSRTYTLIVYNPSSFNLSLYEQDRYEVRWYSTNGQTLSESYQLSCVTAGTYFVDITDNVTGASGRSTVTI